MRHRMAAAQDAFTTDLAFNGLAKIIALKPEMEV